MGLCFAFSLARVLNYSRGQSDPDKTIVRYAHYIQEESVQAGLRAIADAYEKDHPDVSIREVVIPRAVYNSWVQNQVGREDGDRSNSTGYDSYARAGHV